MRKLKILPLILLAAIALTLAAPASFAEENAPVWDIGENEGSPIEAGEHDDFPAGPTSDIAGHWAEATLQRGIDAGLLQGYEDGAIRPNAAITTAQMITILTRALGAEKTAGTAVPANKWYYDAARKAVFLGLIKPDAANLDADMSRQDALAMMAKAFALTPAEPDLKALNAFSDAGAIKAENKASLAALVADKLVQGSAGALNVNGSITRAEFLTILFRVTDKYADASSANLWFGCAAETAALDKADAARVTIKSHELKSLTVGAAKIGRLVIDCGVADVELGDLNGASIDVLQWQGGGRLTVADSVIKTIEITGNGQRVFICGKHDKLIVSGSKNNVILEEGTEIGEVIVLGNKNLIYNGSDVIYRLDLAIGRLTVGGNENQVYLGCLAPIASVNIPGGGGYILIECPEITALSLAGSYNTFSYGDGAVDTAKITGSDNRLVFGGHLNSMTIKSMTIDGRKNTLKGYGIVDLLTINASGNTIDEYLTITTLNDNSRDYDVDRVLALVTYTYAGDYTLAWAQANDYEDYEKEIWVNAKGYSSSTEYLIWVNLAMQRVNIFTGSQGNWTLARSCIIGSGASRSSTPLGVYYTTYKLASGWTTATYSCRPVVGFKAGSGYAFHSRLYYPNSNSLTDASIGFPVSHGCIRMYDEDINFIYNQIPLNTTVVIH